MITKELERIVRNALTKDVEIVFEHPEKMEHGDYSCNIVLLLAQKTKQNPKKLAEKIAKSIEKTKEVERIEVAGPGFLNFF